MKIDEIKWEKVDHWATEKWYSTLYVDKKLWICKQVDVHRDSNGFATDLIRQSFFIDGGNEEYKTIESLLLNYNKITKKWNR